MTEAVSVVVDVKLRNDGEFDGDAVADGTPGMPHFVAR